MPAPMTTLRERAPAADRAARVLVPAGLASATWLALLVAAGLLLRLDSFSLFGLVPLLIVVVMAWPVYVFAPWEEGVAERAAEWFGRSRNAVVLTAALFGVLVIPGLADLAGPAVGLLRFPYRSVSGVLFGASVFYRESVGAAFAEFLFEAARWYVEVVWLYVIASTVTMIVGRLRG